MVKKSVKTKQKKTGPIKAKGKLSLQILFIILLVIILGFCVCLLFNSYQEVTFSKAENHVIDKNLGWGALAMSANGSIIIAGAADLPQDYGSLYISKNSGKTWSILKSAGKHNWTSITCSSDCSAITATARDDNLNTYLLISTNEGKSWTDKGDIDLVEGQDLQSITSSQNGIKLAAVSLDGIILNSSDGGITWHSSVSDGGEVAHKLFKNGGNPPYGNLQAITSSADGTKLAVATSTGDIFTTVNSGHTWVDQTKAGSRDWSAIASSADGKYLIAAADDQQSTGSGGVFLSTDGGATWTYQKQLGSHDWQSVASSANGKVLAALDNGINEKSDAVYISLDGKNWMKDKDIPRNGTETLQLSSDGTLLAVAGEGSIWTVNLQTSILNKLLKNFNTP